MFATKPGTIVYRYNDPIEFSSVSSSGAAAPQSVTIQVNGSTFGVNFAQVELSATAAGSYSPVSGLAPWYMPPSGAPSAVWARLTTTAGTGPTSGDGTGWVSLSGTSASWTWTQATYGHHNCHGHA